ncbi:four helix bundle protein [Arenibacter palladensis]|uniref:four helix bundle protein n=1 Tax=Arenibacter palladensis TaxID=237373 RepID=UPI0026E16509|nr:four helix bundle protein [Arenibacter palladensis]MDO6603713.1 four helix bundle protein [Arenibacter palladensis]
MRFQDLMAYKKSFALAMRIFEISKTFPREERYSLTDQIRRSSRSVSANIAESYAMRLYPKYFINKLTDSDAENLETQVWVEYAMECQYVNNEIFEELIGESREIGKLIYFMINNPDKFGSK